jgi:UDP-GlcNAc:undecaprenyl-phosphate GlcNAc-1-phosphate transferase
LEEFFSEAFLRQVEAHLVPALPPFLLAAVLAAVLAPVAILVARRVGLMALPEPGRRIHKQATPVLGGAVMFLAFATATWLLVHPSRQVAWMLVLAGVATAVFVLDDRRGLPAWAKLGAEAALSLVAVVGFGFGIGFLTLPGVGIVQLAPVVAVPLTLFWLLGMQETVNLLDGVDGLAAGVVAIVALVLVVASSGRGQEDIALVAAALAGACAGFLLFNFHPARIFMGDSGSHFLGLTVGLVSILGVAKIAVAFALVVPVVALAVPILDTAWAIVRRRRRRLSIAHADTQHIHHQLLDFGLTQPQTCVLFYCATGILGAFGLMLFGHKRILSVAIVLLIVAVSTVIGERLQQTRWRVPAPGLRRLLEER